MGSKNKTKTKVKEETYHILKPGHYNPYEGEIGRGLREFFYRTYNPKDRPLQEQLQVKEILEKRR